MPILDTLRARMVSACESSEDISLGAHTPWRPGVVAAQTQASRDPEPQLVDWLREVAPIGVAREIKSMDVFPSCNVQDRSDPIEVLSDRVKGANYQSFQDAKELAIPERNVRLVAYLHDAITEEDQKQLATGLGDRILQRTGRYGSMGLGRCPPDLAADVERFAGGLLCALGLTGGPAALGALRNQSSLSPAISRIAREVAPWASRCRSMASMSCSMCV